MLRGSDVRRDPAAADLDGIQVVHDHDSATYPPQATQTCLGADSCGSPQGGGGTALPCGLPRESVKEAVQQGDDLARIKPVFTSVDGFSGLLAE